MSSTPDTEYKRNMYMFGPRETAGILLGLGMGSLITLFCAAFLMVRLLSYGALGIIIGLLVVAAAVAAVWVPVADRTAGQWAPVLVHYAVRRAFGWTSYRGGPAAELARSTPRREGAEPMELPGELAGTEVLTVPTAVGNIGIIKDVRRRTYCAVVKTRGTAFKLLTMAEQDNRLEAWGDTLNSIAYSGGGIVRLQWLDITTPDSGDSLAREWANTGLQGNTASAANYEQLLDEARPRTQTHENYLVIMLDPRKARRQVKNMGGGDVGACNYLLQRAAQIEEALSSAGVVVEGALPPRAIAHVIRCAYEPGARWKLDARGPVTDDSGGASPAEAGPMAAEERFAYYQTDDTYHAVYWVSEWPRKGVPGSFLEDLILRTAVERTVSVTMQPINPRKAADEVGRSETAKGSDERARGKLGFRTSARERREQQAIERQDQALADGQALYRFLGLIRISAPSPELLDQACGEIETRASTLQLRRLYGEQAIAFPATLPMARGLKWGLISDLA